MGCLCVCVCVCVCVCAPDCDNEGHKISENKIIKKIFLSKTDVSAGEAWVLKEREERLLEAAQMEFLRHLLGITKLDKEKNQCIRQKNKQ